VRTCLLSIDRPTDRCSTCNVAALSLAVVTSSSSFPLVVESEMDMSSAEEQETSWITNFCASRGNEFFCQVDRSYIEDAFNLYGLKSVVENFGECLDLILDRIEPEESDSPNDEARATELYGLIHARYIVTSHGLDAMRSKFLRRDFGSCPRFFCDNAPVLPVGMNDAVGVARVNVFCPRCRQVFRTGCGERVDGAFFGTTFPHLFLMTFGFPRGENTESSSDYVPRVFGFRLHRSAYQRGGGNAGTVAVGPGGVVGGAPQQIAPTTKQQQLGPAAAEPPRPSTTRKRPRDLDDFDDDDNSLEQQQRARTPRHDFGGASRGGEAPAPQIDDGTLVPNHRSPARINPTAVAPAPRPAPPRVPRFHDATSKSNHRQHHSVKHN